MFRIMTYALGGRHSRDHWTCSRKGRANLEASEASLDGFEAAECHVGTTNPSKPAVLAPPQATVGAYRAISLQKLATKAT